MHDALEDAKCRRYQDRDYAVVPEEWNKGKGNKQNARRDAACTLGLNRHILANHTRNEIDKATRIVSLLPLVKYKEQVKYHYKLLNNRKIIH